MIVSMFPKKNMFETSEMNRLFSQSIENDAVPHYSSLFQSPVANRSSSSAESVSPENYFDFQFNQEMQRSNVQTSSPKPAYNTFHDLFESPPNSELFQSYNTHDLFTRSPQIYESPRSSINIDNSMCRQRPIMGRKILGGTSQVKIKEKTDTNLADFWQDSITPPNSHPKSYELFPRPEDFECPVYNQTASLSPSMSNNSNATCALPRPCSSSSNYTNLTRSSYNLNSTNFKVPQANSQIALSRICTFCRKNGEMPLVYGNHCVKEKVGGKYIVTCPILRSHVCQTCGVSGDDAHTITYCPVLRNSNNGRPLTSTTITLKNTRMKSNGKPRY